MAEENTTNSSSTTAADTASNSDTTQQPEESEAMKILKSDQGSFIVDPKNFLLPTMGDYYLGAVDTRFLEKLDFYLFGEDYNKKSAERAAYYMENPPIKQFGSWDGINYVKGKLLIDQDFIDIGTIDANTLCIQISSLEGDTTDREFKVLQEVFTGD